MWCSFLMDSSFVYFLFCYFFSLFPKSRVLTLYSGNFEITSPLGTLSSVFSGSSFFFQNLSLFLHWRVFSLSWWSQCLPIKKSHNLIFESSFSSCTCSKSFFCLSQVGFPQSGLWDKDQNASSLSGRWLQEVPIWEWGNETRKGRELVPGMSMSGFPLWAVGTLPSESSA